MSDREPKWMSLSLARKFEDMAKDLGVSKVARSSRGFFTQYKKAQGHPDRLTEWWRNRRNNFVKRHMAQVKAHGESLVKDGLPTRRHLALIMWAYSPMSEDRLKKMLTTYKENPGSGTERLDRFVWLTANGVPERVAHEIAFGGQDPGEDVLDDE